MWMHHRLGSITAALVTALSVTFIFRIAYALVFGATLRVIATILTTLIISFIVGMAYTALKLRLPTKNTTFNKNQEREIKQ
jgi:uncharacterized membrane protein YraQ (UPF0718 family)